MSKPLLYTTDLTDHFLIAMPGMGDELFAGSLVYVCEHNKDGALGLIVNKTADITVQALFERLNMHLPRADLAALPVLMGGPMFQDRGFVLHDTELAAAEDNGTDGGADSGAREGADGLGAAGAQEPSQPVAGQGVAYASSLLIRSGLAMTSSRDVMDDLASGAGPRHALLALGCSSWDGGQLESELVANAWLTVKADPDLLFHLPVAQRYARAFELLGVNPRDLVAHIGHA